MLFGEDETLCGRTVLEVGSGRGSSTRELVDLLSGQPGATLIVTDVSDSHFPRLRQELAGRGVELHFVRTGACELDGIENRSIDLLVCKYTLCAVNAHAGRAALALNRFREVLRA